jgi:hypothetical protein
MYHLTLFFGGGVSLALIFKHFVNFFEQGFSQKIDDIGLFSNEHFIQILTLALKLL